MIAHAWLISVFCLAGQLQERWIGISTELVREFIRRCALCETTKIDRGAKERKNPLTPIIANFPMQHIQVCLLI